MKSVLQKFVFFGGEEVGVNKGEHQTRAAISGADSMARRTCSPDFYKWLGTGAP